MSSKNKTHSVILASAVAALMVTVSPIAMAGHADKTDNVKCYGVNACKGKSSCKTASSACKTHNSCKATGFVMVSKEACDQLGGKTEDSDK